MDPLSPHLTPCLLEWLAHLGYRVARRQDVWCEVFLERGEERWLGRGLSEEAALADALRQMFPSHAARVLVAAETWRGNADPQATEVSRSPETDDAAAAPEDARAHDDRPLVDEPSAPTIGPGEEPPGAVPDEPPPPEWEIEPPRELAPTPAAPAIAASEAPAASRGPSEMPSTEPPAPRPPSVPAPSLTVEEALAALEPLEDRIGSGQGELALMAPERQRLVVLSWIARGRALEAATGGAEVIERRVATIARRLSGLCKRLWPGSVKALQLHAAPGDAAREFGLNGQTPPRTWDAVVDLAEARQDVLAETDAREGLDEYGWADASALVPAPRDPDAELGQLRHEMEAVLGAVDAPPPSSGPHGASRPSAADQARFLAWAQRARWVRGSATDFVAWGAVVGRLRWLASRGQAGPGVSEALDPRFRPAVPWARALGRDPAARERVRRRKELFQRVPTDATPAAELAGWLVAALDVFDNDELARLLVRARQGVAALDAATAPELGRSGRRRLRKLQERLAQVDAVVPEAAAPDFVAIEVPDAGPEEPDVPDRLAELIAQIRPHTAGRRALFVGNRNDPNMTQTLATAFELATVDGCDGTPRRLQTAAERVAQGSYDFVLCATGFQSHSADDALYAVCRRAGVPYVRVNRGRLLASALALGRTLGLTNGSNAAGATQGAATA